MRKPLCLVAVLLFASSVFAQDAAAPVAPAPESVPPPATAADYAAKLDALWKTRDAAATAKETDQVISAALKDFPKDYELLWRASRYRWWQADGTTSEKLRKQIAKEGWNYGTRALETKKDGYEAKYFVAINIGAYSQAVGILKALGEGLEGKFNENLDASIKANEAFDMYGPRVSKGRYYWELPWPKRDLEKSKIELEKAIKGEPRHLRAQMYLAETLLKDGKAKEAKVLIDKVLAGSTDYDPPEGRRVKAWAKDVAAQIAKELD